MECRKHNHGSDHGVCPCCLRHKLSLLSSSSCLRRSSPPSSPSSSSSASPAATRSRAGGDIHKRSGSMSFAVREALTNFYGSELRKSRSMAFAPADNVAGGHTTTTATKKKKPTTAVKKLGFWTKLLPFRGKAHEGLFLTRQRFDC